ncbi:ATP-dependent helicase HrpA [Moraxella macacae 0408225]|uniref:ATP-dependent helicase HrpA n=1 Tax=Moraxella macacae 0408225 TaxID=1230338 RepID=L2F799_9GAMM|nr:ATP-dependent RNA helicase HrpA [Moraxella macacae]ELA08631.1 ATP-dependent helicase HrpA [Moraxella macacae 0408225]
MTEIQQPVLSKDRFFLQKSFAKIKKLDKNAQNYQNLVDSYQERLQKSQQQAKQRFASFPAIVLNDELPVSQQAKKLIHAIQNHQVIIVAGETGSGKTTQLPKIAMLAGRGISGQIGHTQPRRLAARSVAGRIAEELGEPLGQTVSFKVRFSEQGSPNSIIKLMTDGILLAELAYDRFLSRYDTIIIDEAHERSLNIDFILGYLKKILPKRPDLKVIITSATLDTERFSQYFATPDNKQSNNKQLDNNKQIDNNKQKPAPVFVVEGRSFPVEVRYRPLTDKIVQSADDDTFDDVAENLPTAIVNAVNECYQDAREKGHQDQADILIFAATEAQIHDIADTLVQYGPKHTQILPLFARQTFANQQQIFQPTSGRRIIIATNVAETALTVPNIRYVIDLGFARISRYAYRSRVQRLPIEAISQASANQRKGRCGRVAAGVCIRLYSEEDFNSRPVFTEPEILRTNLASVILQMANLGLGDIEDFDFIEKPDGRLMNDGRKLLQELGAICTKPTKSSLKLLTNIGEKMAKMPIDPRLARMLLGAEQFGCLKELLVIVAALSVQDPRERPVDKQTQADQKHALFRQENSDFLFYVNLWQAIYGSLWQNDETPLDNDEQNEPSVKLSVNKPSVNKPSVNKLSNSQRKNFAKQHFLSPSRLREWQQTHAQLLQMVQDLGLKINQEPATFALIHRALLTGLLSFIAHKINDVAVKNQTQQTKTKVKNQRGEYLVARQHKAKIFPSSVLFKQNPDWVMAFEIIETSQVFMRNLAKIEPEWVLFAGRDLLKYHYFEPHWSQKTGQVKAYAQISLFGLIVVHKQLVNYETVNLAKAHDIFLQDALVLGRLGKDMSFLRHNLAKVANVALIEDKLRRRDLLVDEEQLYQFYAKRIPTHIASRKAFEDWLAEAEKNDPQCLLFTDSDVLNDTAPTTQAFPESWQLHGLKLPLSYIFDPTSDDDGVTIKIPLQALPQLDSVEILWGIKGWRYDLVLQLLKTLPKEIRRQIVPIPDTAKKIHANLAKNHHAGLLNQLCKALTHMGVRGQNNQLVEPTDFEPKAVDRYLQPQIALVDEKNRLIDKGRDVDALKLRHQIATHQAVSISQGLHDEFIEHFDFVKNKHSAGVLIKQFSALVADKKQREKVALHHFTDFRSAIYAHYQGVLALLRSKLGAKAKQLTGQISTDFKLAFAPLGDLEQLKILVIDATLDATFAKVAPKFNHDAMPIGYKIDDKDKLLFAKLPLTADEFLQTKTQVLANFLFTGQNVLQQLQAIYQTWQQIRGRLLMLDRDIFAESIDDIEDQLDNLNLADFIYRMDYAHWQQYPRYLQALLVRLDRLEHNLDSDLEAVYVLDKHMERLANKTYDETIAHYRWLVEEFRIQLFAQPMKTLMPVSDKRLEKAWEALR